MGRLKVYYPKSQIMTGLYTEGLEWMTDNGLENIGPYHTYADGNVYSGSEFNISTSKNLVPYKETFANPGKDNFRYRQLTTIQVDKYVEPKYYLHKLISDEIQQGWFIRYFVQKRNDRTMTTIKEVDKKQYDRVSFSNAEVINGNLYKKLDVRWKISGTDTEIKNINRIKVLSANSDMPGLIGYLGNLLEYSEAYRIWSPEA